MRNRKSTILLCTITDCKRGDACPNFAPSKNLSRRVAFNDCMYHPSFTSDKQRAKHYE